MEVKIDELLDFLEKPENEGQIQYLANFEYLNKLKDIKGAVGVLVRIGTSLVKKQMDAMMALAQCKTTADITAFRQTPHYKTLQKAPLTITHDNTSIKDLKVLENLKELEEIDKKI